MTKNEYINKIVCEYWFCLVSWKGRHWDDRKKQIWLSGMHRAWDVIFPSDQIGPLEIVSKATIWTKEEAEKWYADYLSAKEDDDGGGIEDRCDILDL